MTALVWFRSDLRTDDNTALYNALTRHQRVEACYLLTPITWRQHDRGPRMLRWLWDNLMELRATLAEAGVRLHIREAGDFANSADTLNTLIDELDISDVYANIEYPVDERERDEVIAEGLAQRGIGWHAYHDYIVMPPGTVLTGSNEPYKVFTPFKRAWIAGLGGEQIPCLSMPRSSQQTAVEPPPLPAWRPAADPASPDWWPAGEHAARDRLLAFVEEGLEQYHEQRDLPAVDGTSRLSPYLAIGAISVRRCFEAALAVNGGEWTSGKQGVTTWLSELIWREFYQHVLVAFPRVSRHRAFKPETEALRWRDADDEFQAWCEGRTGFPLVDAAMKQLVETGWMHNRLRMVTAMFLTKYLMIDWHRGERFFTEQLIDGELGANNGGWQWSASTGTDAAPYFRVLSPLRQAERFDPDGHFTTRFLPELAGIKPKALVTPGCEALLSRGYPAPIVDLKHGRERVLDAFRSLDKSGAVSA